MKKREFLKMLGVGGLGLAAPRVAFPSGTLRVPGRAKKMKHWAWMTPELEPSADVWKKRFSVMRRSGIDAIIPEVYDGRHAYYESKRLPVREAWLEKVLPLAKAEGLEFHAWMWAMPCNIEQVRRKNPEWFSVNRKGESAADKPAYVEYYRFLCPSRPEVREFIEANVAELAQVDALDGIHLDYIRYPDVILAEGIQPKYGIRQDREYPEYDYCYCDVCVREFKKETGIELAKVGDPTSSSEWRQFRYDRITRLVNDRLIPIARREKKLVTAAVFPNWEAVRQQWSEWNLDAVLPMLYNAFYYKDIDWIGEQTKKGVQSLRGRMPLYSGLFVPSFNPEGLVKAVEAALQGGAEGIALFSAGAMTEDHWRQFQELVSGRM